MQISSVNAFMIDRNRDGVVTPVMQRPMDGHFPVGLEIDDKQPSHIGQQHRSTTGPVQCVPELPGDLQPISHGLASIGSRPAQATQYGNIHPGGFYHHAPSPGQPVLSLNQMMFRCSEMMDLLVQQQHQLQKALTTMAAAPSSTTPTVREVPLQHPDEVMLAAQCSPASCLPSEATTPHSSVTMCHEPSLSSDNNRSHPRAHTNTIIDASTSPFVASLASEEVLKPAGEMSCDVIVEVHERWKLVQDSKQCSQQSESDEGDSSSQQFEPRLANPLNHLSTQAPGSQSQNDISADVIDQHRVQVIICSAACVAYGAIQQDISRHKEVNINLSDSSRWPSSGEYGRTGVFKAGGASGRIHFTLWQHQHPSLSCKVKANANGALVLQLKEGKPVPFVEELPPWPPPVCASNSPKHTFSIIRGGRDNKMSISVAMKRPATSHTCLALTFHEVHVQSSIGRIIQLTLLSACSDLNNIRDGMQPEVAAKFYSLCRPTQG